jgi:hypothetical protein
MVGGLKVITLQNQFFFGSSSTGTMGSFRDFFTNLKVALSAVSAKPRKRPGGLEHRERSVPGSRSHLGPATEPRSECERTERHPGSTLRAGRARCFRPGSDHPSLAVGSGVRQRRCPLDLVGRRYRANREPNADPHRGASRQFGRAVYAGITYADRFDKRVTEHGDRFKDVVAIDLPQLTRAGARGVEQVIIENLPGLQIK